MRLLRGSPWRALTTPSEYWRRHFCFSFISCIEMRVTGPTDGPNQGMAKHSAVPNGAHPCAIRA
jgi:hypothetical protein